VAHNRCVDELRRPLPPAPEMPALARSRVHDPVADTDTRESLRRLIADIRRLPDQQRSALLMRELGGMSYCEVATALSTTVPAVKSLLVRSRMALVRAGEARDTACKEIREQLTVAHDRGVRASALARRHMRDCADCRTYRSQLQGMHRGVAALLPAGPLALWSKLVGLPGGSATGAGGPGGGAAVAGTGGAGGAGALVGANHVATLLAAAIASAGGAVGLQHVFAPPAPSHAPPGVSSSERPQASRGPGPRDAPGLQSSAPSDGAARGISSGYASAMARRTTTQRAPGPTDRAPATQTARQLRTLWSVSESTMATLTSSGSGWSSTVTPTAVVGTTAGPPSSSTGSGSGSPSSGSPGTGSTGTGQTVGGSSAGGQPAGGTSGGGVGSGASGGQTAGGGQTSGDGSAGGAPGTSTTHPGSGTPTQGSPGVTAGSNT
jgi:hypothetical protein